MSKWMIYEWINRMDLWYIHVVGIKCEWIYMYVYILITYVYIL